MQQGVGLAKAVGRGAADHLETFMQVEAQGLQVLLVDVQGFGIEFVDGVAQQAPAHALATVGRGNEEHIHPAAGDPGEPADTLAVLAADQHHGVEVAVQHMLTQQPDIGIG